MRVKKYIGETPEELSSFPNFSATGSSVGMKERYYGKGALLVRNGKFIYNVTSKPEIYHEQSV